MTAIVANTESGKDVEVRDAHASTPQTMILTYRYKVLMSKANHVRFQEALTHTALLYNAALEEQIDRYHKYKTYIKTADDAAYAKAKRVGREKTYTRARGFTSKFDQYKGLTKLRKDLEYAVWPATLQRWAIERCQESFKGFFSRVQRGQKAGFPRFRSAARLRAFGFTDANGWTLHDKTLTMKSIGKVRLKMHRPLPENGKLKTLTMRKGPKGWYANFAVEVPINQKAPADYTSENTKRQGLDVGVINSVALSNGTLLVGPRPNDRFAKEVRKASRALARCQRGSKRREKVRARLSRMKAKEAQARTTHLHQVARAVANQCDVVYVEKLNIKGMTKKAPGKHGLNRSLQDAALGKLKTLLVYKMRLKGGFCVEVDPRYSSQTCAECGHCEKKNRKGEVFVCRGCGHVDHADINAAKVLKFRGVVAPGTHKLAVAPTGARNIS